ncbi:MAG: glutamate decarboxylase, partial [Solirubrobacteraceae bacterium]
MALSTHRAGGHDRHPPAAAVHHPRPDMQIPHHALAPHGLGEQTSYELLTNELLLDGQARLNLATFVTTWMPSLAARLMDETADKNIIDKDEYPQTAEIEARCVNILADLWHADAAEQATGCSTTGSSEAAMLAGLAMKWRWRERMRAAGKPTDRPNLVTGINVQVCWEKFMRYWDVEPRLVPMEGDRFHLDAEGAVSLCDENTIGVVGVLGSTFDGSYEPIKEIAAALDDLQARTGLDIPLHVDGASGGFVAPFLEPELEWDFRLPRVCSINASGHKYGLVYPGVGWAIWRNKEALPEDLIFDVNYLGGHMPTFALNFSRPGSEVIAQYFMFTSLGHEGYRRVMQNAQDVALKVSSGIAELGPYRLLTSGDQLPVFAFTLNEDVTNYSVFDVSAHLRQRGWLVPAYNFPANRQDLSVLRIVVRAGMSLDMADLLLQHIREETEALESLDGPLPHRKGGPLQA